VVLLGGGRDFKRQGLVGDLGVRWEGALEVQNRAAVTSFPHLSLPRHEVRSFFLINQKYLI
jgi:hypothetical protein